MVRVALPLNLLMIYLPPWLRVSRKSSFPLALRGTGIGWGNEQYERGLE